MVSIVNCLLLWPKPQSLFITCKVGTEPVITKYNILTFWAFRSLIITIFLSHRWYLSILGKNFILLNFSLSKLTKWTLQERNLKSNLQLIHMIFRKSVRLFSGKKHYVFLEWYKYHTNSKYLGLFVLIVRRSVFSFCVQKIIDRILSRERYCSVITL